jgi:hypothetical protein
MALSENDARQKAKKLPKPQPGMTVQTKSVEELCMYIELHGLQPLGWRGDLLVCKMPALDNMSVEDVIRR